MTRPRKTGSPSLLAVLLGLAVLGNAVAGEPYTLRVEARGWGEAGEADVEKVLRSACDAIAQHLDGGELAEPIRVRHDREGPITLFQRSVRGEIIVQLSSKDLFWCQYAYQMAHEFGHVLCRFRKGGRENLWFEESLCELASLFAIRSMAKAWQTEAPYPNWRGYAKSLAAYAADVEREFMLAQGKSAAEFYRLHAERLRKSPTERELNGKIARALLPFFEAKPSGWRALEYLNQGRGKDDLPFSEHLKNWREQCPAELRPFVGELAAELGIEL